MMFDLHHNIRDGGCTTATFQSTDNENATCETLILGCGIPTSFASEKIVHMLRFECSTQVVLISKSGIEYRTLYSVY